MITDRADIFALGLTLWEMMTLSMPHLEMLEGEEEGGGEGELLLHAALVSVGHQHCACFSDSMEKTFDEDAYYECLGTRPPLEAEPLGSSYQRMVELFYVCTEEDARKRPSASQIVQALESNAVLEDPH